ncbi:MAG: hypothetical protein ACTSU5_20190 [Promethearchaeota archaeon]
MVANVDRHDISFFGQKTALILTSTSRSEAFVFARFLRKKYDGTWEKPSRKEGLVVKLNLLELVAVRDVLTRERLAWRTFHTFKQNKTPISVQWNSANEGASGGVPGREADFVWFNAGDYSRPTRYPETALLREVLVHLVKEKVEFATKSITEANGGTRYSRETAGGSRESGTGSTRPGTSQKTPEKFTPALTPQPPRVQGPGRDDWIVDDYPDYPEYIDSSEQGTEFTPEFSTSPGGGSTAVGVLVGARGVVGKGDAADLGGRTGRIELGRSLPGRGSSRGSVGISGPGSSGVSGGLSPPSTSSRSTDRELSSTIRAKIVRSSQKAVLLKTGDGKEFWAPKSMISSDYDEESRGEQEFIVATWVLRKHQVVA